MSSTTVSSKRSEFLEPIHRLRPGIVVRRCATLAGPARRPRRRRDCSDLPAVGLLLGTADEAGPDVGAGDRGAGARILGVDPGQRSALDRHGGQLRYRALNQIGAQNEDCLFL